MVCYLSGHTTLGSLYYAVRQINEHVSHTVVVGSVLTPEIIGIFIIFNVLCGLHLFLTVLCKNYIDNDKYFVAHCRLSVNLI